MAHEMCLCRHYSRSDTDSHPQSHPRQLSSKTLSRNWFFKEADRHWFSKSSNDANGISTSQRKISRENYNDDNDNNQKKEAAAEKREQKVGEKKQTLQPDVKIQERISNWLPVRSVPSTIHTDLLYHDIISDPFVGFNECKVEWVGERRWAYRTAFTLPCCSCPSGTGEHEIDDLGSGGVDNDVIGNEGGMKTKAVLVFDGLDTLASVKVDGVEVLHTDNMFRTWRLDVSYLLDQDRAQDDRVNIGRIGVIDDMNEDGYINIGTDGGVRDSEISDEDVKCSKCMRKCPRSHDLEIVFEPAVFKAQEVKNLYPEHKWVCFNGDPARLAVRKAQYHWGWDWGPFLMCAGIWREVRLEVYNVRISDVRIDVVFGSSLSDVTVHVTYETEGWNHDNKNEGNEATRLRNQIADHARANLTLTALGKKSGNTGQLTKAFDCGKRNVKMDLHDPNLWWPSGYGDQSLYEIEVSIFSANNTLLDKVTKRIGLRKLELVQELDEHGKSFYFRVNEVDVFCGGSCWIPADSFLTSMTRKRYKEWIELMVPANQKMIRVWGGGVYENDAFYDVCDELGILVWQDFMFACGNYPIFPEMLESIKAEAVDNIRRIRHHPSLALLAGNNEDYQVQEQSGLTYNYADKNEQHWLKTDFPARYIYESLLPKVVSNECPFLPYHPGSPWGDGKVTSDPTVGDLHQWNVWHGSQEKYQIFDSLGGRFNSEFGMEAFPHIETIQAFVENEKDLYPQSRVIDFHNKASGHERRIATYMIENVRAVTDLEGYIHLTQLIQCEALMYGYRGWRKQWGEGRKCGGALVWQLNDCWPVTSWSICDYYLRRKPSYYAMARVLAPIAIGIRRDHHDWSESHAREPSTQQWEMWVVSSYLEEVKASIEVRFLSVQTGKEIKKPLILDTVVLAPNGTTNLANGIIDNLSQEPHVLAANIRVNGKIVSRDVDWPQPLKYLEFLDRKPWVRFERNQIEVGAQRPVKCLVFEEREGVFLSDSALDVMPGDIQRITVNGLKKGDAPLRWTYLGAGEQ